MATELKRGAIRILSNYTRLFLLLVMGIVLVPIFIHGIGAEAFGLFGLLGSTLGIAEMCRVIVRESMNRELGEAFHSPDPESLADTLNAALVVSAALAVVTALLFAGLWLILPLLNTANLLGPARWFVATHGLLSTLIVLLGPLYNMYLVSERLVLFNTWSTLNRGTDLIAAVVLFIVLGINDPATGLKLFAVLSAATSIAVLLIAVGLIIHMDRRLMPNPARIRRQHIRRILPTTGWNGVAVTAMNLHIRVDQLIMNVFFGVIGNAMFTLGVRLSSYVRLIACGGTDGLDVVSARLSATDSDVSVSRLMREATRMHAVVAFPACALVLILGEPLMKLWVGKALNDPDTLAKAVVIAMILVIGMTVRGIADSWTRILYGAGFIRRYAPLILVGGLCNPLLALGLIWALPDSIAYQAPAIAFSAVFVVVQFLLIPRIAAQCLNISVTDVLQPLVRPCLAAMLSSMILWLPWILHASNSLFILVATVAAFGAAHAALCWFYVLGETDRHRLRTGVARRLKLAPAK